MPKTWRSNALTESVVQDDASDRPGNPGRHAGREEKAVKDGERRR